MSDWKVIGTFATEDGNEFLRMCHKFAKKADKRLPNWAEIRFDEEGKCFAFTVAPFCDTSWWVSREGGLSLLKHPIEFDFLEYGIDWQTFGIIRNEAKPTEQSKKSKLRRELSATRAMLEEAQREIAELSEKVRVAERTDWATIRQTWHAEGWDDGAAAMLKAAQNAEAVLIYECNGGEMDFQAAMGAARVVGAVQNGFGTGIIHHKKEEVNADKTD